MRFTIRGTVLLVVLGLLTVVLRKPAIADGDEKQGVTTIRRSLAAFRAPPAVAGPNLGTPADLIAQKGDLAWNVDPGDERLGWLEFDQPAFDNSALSYAELSQVFEAEYWGIAGLGIDVDEYGRLEAVAPASAAAAAEANLDWIIGAMTPAVVVEARLDRTAPEARLRAVGQAKLWPGRWMPVFFQKDEIPYVVDFHLEIAQESTAADPVTANLVEGCELYMRYHPGERVSVVEVWIADVEHLDEGRIDLSEIRNVPEGNALGVLNAPETAIDRAFGYVVLPAGKTVEREIVWTRKGRAQRLALRFSAPAPLPPRALPDGNALALLRIGALASALEFGARPADEDRWPEALGEIGGPSSNVGAFSGGYLASARARTEDLARIVEYWKAKEASLVEHTVSLDVWRVPEGAYRAALDEGSIAVGKVVAAETLQALRQAGGASCGSVRMPVLDATGAGFRVGDSVPGVIDFNTEVAQQAAGLHPHTWALFRGVFGDITVSGGYGQTVVHAAGEVVWADADAGTAELVFRSPVSMKPAGNGQMPEPDHRRRVKMPLLSGGSSTFDVRLPVSGDAETLFHASVRGDETTLVLVRAVPRR